MLATIDLELVDKTEISAENKGLLDRLHRTCVDDS